MIAFAIEMGFGGVAPSMTQGESGFMRVGVSGTSLAGDLAAVAQMGWVVRELNMCATARLCPMPPNQ